LSGVPQLNDLLSSCHGVVDMPRNPIRSGKQRRIDLVDVTFRHAVSRVTDQRLNGRNGKANAVLEALYAIRCNMFQGQKTLQVRQLTLLRPAILLLEITTDVLYQAL